MWGSVAEEYGCIQAAQRAGGPPEAPGKSKALFGSFFIGRLDQKKWYRPTHHQVYMLGEQKNNLPPARDGYIDIVGEGRETSVGHSQGTVSRPAVEGGCTERPNSVFFNGSMFKD